MLSVGIDFGTSNSSVAAYDGTSVHLVPLDPTSRDPRVLRSVIYIEKSGQVTYGQKALDLYLAQNTGRAARYEMRRVGQIEMEFAELGTLVRDAYALVDINEPGRLFQSLKRFLTTKVGIGASKRTSPFVQETASATAFQTTNVFGLSFRIEELLALLAKEIVRLTQAALDAPITTMTVGWPVRFSSDPEEEQLARDRLREAWRLATSLDVRFVEEPIAAISHFATQAETRRQENVLVFDFGGGTLDVCVARLEGGRATPLATAGVPIGGDLLDSRIVETRLAPLFGEEATYRATGLPLPRHLFRRLQTWQTLSEMNKPEYIELIRRARHECDQPDQLGRLEMLVSRNYGPAFFQAVERAKVALSSELEAEVTLLDGGLDIAERLTRDEFVAAIGPQMRSAAATAEEAVRNAGLTPDEINLVVTTGGSSLIPAFQAMLRESFSNAAIEESDAFTSVASGLAVNGYHDAAG